MTDFQTSLILLSFVAPELHWAFTQVQVQRNPYLYRTAVSTPKAPTIKSRKKWDILHITICFLKYAVPQRWDCYQVIAKCPFEQRTWISIFVHICGSFQWVAKAGGHSASGPLPFQDLGWDGIQTTCSSIVDIHKSSLVLSPIWCSNCNIWKPKEESSTSPDTN